MATRTIFYSKVVKFKLVIWQCPLFFDNCIEWENITINTIFLMLHCPCYRLAEAVYGPDPELRYIPPPTTVIPFNLSISNYTHIVEKEPEPVCQPSF